MPNSDVRQTGEKTPVQSAFKSTGSSGPPRFTRGGKDLMTTATTSGALEHSPLQPEGSAENPHEFLGKELASLLEGTCSPGKEISDFNPTTANFESKVIQQQSGFPAFQLNQIIINNYKEEKDSVPHRAGKATDTQSDAYLFPDGGWVCSECQNYNF